MDGWFPFQDVPGLLTPEMSSNVRTNSILGAAAGLLNAAGPSREPVNIFAALGQGLQGGLQGYERGQTQAVRMSLMREQMEKLIEARRQAAQWAALFGAPAGSTSGAMASVATNPPASAPTSVPVPPVSAPATTDRAPVPSSPKVWGDDEAVAAGLYPPPSKPAAQAPTRRDVQTAAAGGLRNVIAEMPAGMREMIAIAGPEKGKEILAQYVGKKADKPSDSWLTVQYQDGSTKPFRADDPNLDAAVRAGATIVTTPSSRGSNALVALRMPNGTTRNFRADDPAIDAAISEGAIEVTKASSNPNERTVKPDNYVLPNGETVLSSDGKSYVDPVDGSQKTMPSNAIKLGSDTAYDASRQAKVAARAQNELSGSPSPARPPAENAASQGTGTWSNLQAASNAVVGGLGLDKAFGVKGIFPQNEANRNYLANIRQMAKTALVNNPRFPVAEQATVGAMFPDPEKFWANPRTEMDKVPLLRNTLEEQLRANNEAIAAGGLDKAEVSRLTSNNIETRRALRLLGHGDSSLKALGDNLGTAPVALQQTPQSDFASRWNSLSVGFRVKQGGKTYEKQADGTAKEVEQ